MIEFKLGQEWSHENFSKGNIRAIQCKKENKPFSFGLFLEFWSMGCCGIGTFHSAGSLSILTAEELNVFFNWLNQQRGPGGWVPREWMFSLSDIQIGSEAYMLLLRHKNIKQIDSFMNKAHGPARMYIYRYSSTQDFQ